MAHPIKPLESENEGMENPLGLQMYHRGPPPADGPLPSLFYFALSGHQSLYLDPFRQPADLLAHLPIRVFSFSLPYHGDGYDPYKSIEHWISELQNGHDIIREFTRQAAAGIQFLIDEGWVECERIAVAGISRGAFIASHLASMDARIRWLLGFAPMTSFLLDGKSQEWLKTPLIDSLGLIHLSALLADKHIRFYIGNRDVRVGTEQCFAAVRDIAEKAYQKGVRSPPVELIISPSIGYKGHGTGPHIFQDGIKWLKSCMLKDVV